MTIIINTPDILKIVAFVFIGSLVLGLLRNALSIGKDDSDTSGWKRSGFRVMTDHKTGIQYLSDNKGGLVKRDRARAAKQRRGK